MAEVNNNNAQTADVNEQVRIRMDKLKALQEAGKDPFQITKYDVTHHTSDVRSLYEALEAKLLAGRTPVSTEGLDEQQAREVTNNDYNERRAIMDA
ncbi:MAG: lysine--tRNA ligase, partial [Lachnospiraceae bacterium]